MTSLHKIFLSLAALSCSVHAAHYRVYLLGGQSNGNGRGDASELTAPLNAAQPDVRFYWHKTQVTTNGNLTQDTWLDLQPDSGHGVNSPAGHAVEFGSELSFGRSMADSNPSVNIAIIKYTHGGTNLHTQWSATGTNYATFVATVQAGLTSLTNAGHTYELGGMVWIQGEADTAVTNANNYNANLTSLIERVRKDISSPGCSAFTMPFVISGLSNSQYSNITTVGSGPYIVRQAQENVAAAGRQTAFVNTDGFSTYTNGTVHFDATSQIAIGQACATQMLALEANDTDRDGLLNSEETTLGSNPDMVDTDADGFDDGQEVALGTDPINGESLFQITSFIINPDDSATMTWPSKSGNKYIIEKSTTLGAGSWTNVATVTATGATTTWNSATSGTSTNLAFYGLEGTTGGNFDSASYDSTDTETTTTASRLSQGGGLSGGGANSRILNNIIFAPTASGNNGLNLGNIVGAKTNANSFAFTIQSNGNEITYSQLSFFHNQFNTEGKVDVSYKIASGAEVPILTGFTPTTGNTAVTQEVIDFTDFNTTSDVTFTFYLYGTAAASHGIRFDDIELKGSTPVSSDKKTFYRVKSDL